MMNVAAQAADESDEPSLWFLLGPAIVSAAAGVLGVAAGALLQSRAQRRDWLRDQRHVAYADLLARFGEAMSASAIAVSADIQLARNDIRLSSYVRDAWDKGDRFRQTYDRMTLVASKAARRAAAPLADAVTQLRKLPPISAVTVSKGPPPTWTDNPVSINEEVVRRSKQFRQAAITDVGGEPIGEGE